MAIISAVTYFKKYPIDLDVSAPIKIELIDLVTDYCEEIYLKKLLGITEYYKYLADKGQVTHDPKYTALLTAANFEYQSKTYRLDVKQMIAYFTYSECLVKNTSDSTSLGETSSNVEGTAKVSFAHKYWNAFNLGVELYDQAKLYLINQSSDFPDCESEIINKGNIYGI